MSQEMINTDAVYGFGFKEPIRAVILGSRGGVGEAIARALIDAHPLNRALLTSRSLAELPLHSEMISWYALEITSEDQWEIFIPRLKSHLADWGGSLNLVINATGLLHTEGSARAGVEGTQEVQPERSMRAVALKSMESVFAVNTFAVALALKYLSPMFPRRERSLFVSFSARVGSISDNRIGGWYSYRASKAAQNMLIKTAAIELSRSKKECVCVAVHPGTVASALSAPFTKSVKHTIFTPEQSASSLIEVLERLTPERTGECIAWDGATIPA